MKTTKNKKKSTKKVATKKSNTVNGIETLPSGSYRVRKSINNKQYYGIFTTMRDAVAFRNMLNS